ALHGRAYRRVDGQQVDAVTGPVGQRGEQERGVDGRVEPGLVPDPGGGGAPGVQDAQDPPVPLGPVGTGDDVGAPGAGPPVDRPYVVADHVLAQRVELRALAPAPGDDHPGDDPQPGQLLRQQPAGGEPGQHAQPPGRRHRVGAAAGRLPVRQAQRAEGADGDPDSGPVPAPGRTQGGDQAYRGVRVEVEVVPVRAGAGRRYPGVAYLRVNWTYPRVGDRQGDLGGVVEAH